MEAEMTLDDSAGELDQLGQHIRENGWNIALHEAGHAVAAVVLGLGLKFTDIKPRRSDEDGRIILGWTVLDEIEAREIARIGEEAAFPYLVELYAAGAAESLIGSGKRDFAASEIDFAEAHRFAITALCEFTEGAGGRLLVSSEAQGRKAGEIDALKQCSMAAADSLVNRYSAAITKVAEALCERNELSAHEVEEIASQHPPQAGLN
jgi:ATP-dependent Zn protease